MKTKESQMTMTTEKSVKMKFFIAGSGDINIDWGDGSEKETHELLVIDEDFYDDDQKDKFMFCRFYSGVSSRTITVIGASITHLACENSRLSRLDVNRNPLLSELSCENNQITRLDVSQNIMLTKLFCSSNQLASLDVSKNTQLTALTCGYNQLTNLDVSNNAKLTYLLCSDNQLMSLDVSNNKGLIVLSCGDNQLTELDVNYNPELTGLICRNNQIAALDVSKNTKLIELQCQHNLLKDLDVSACTMLRRFKCHSNQFARLDYVFSHLLNRINEISAKEIAPNKYAIFYPMYTVDGEMYPIFLAADPGHNRFYLSDEGATYAELDKIFEMTEPAVIKNLVAIMKQYGCRKQPKSHAFTIECTPQDAHLKISHFIQCLSFMLNMKIFYS